MLVGGSERASVQNFPLRRYVVVELRARLLVDDGTDVRRKKCRVADDDFVQPATQQSQHLVGRVVL